MPTPCHLKSNQLVMFSAGHYQAVLPQRAGPVLQQLHLEGGVNVVEILGLPDQSGDI